MRPEGLSLKSFSDSIGNGTRLNQLRHRLPPVHMYLQKYDVKTEHRVMAKN
jgi:hypothetical protein